MGLEQRVAFSEGILPRWTDVADVLERREFPVRVRMIDGELALPDDAVPESWRELRVSTPPGMVTLKRQNDGVVLATWGNADSNLKQAWNALAWALAKVGNGRIEAADGKHDSAGFHRTAELPATVKKVG